MSLSPFDYAASTALITGASRGIGAEFARQLAARGVRILILTARTEPDLATLAEELRAAHAGIRVETIAADLTDPSAPDTLRDQIDRLRLRVDLLVNNAGFGSHGFFDELSSERETDMVQVNIAAIVRLTHLFLGDMVARDQGGVVNVASTAGFTPTPFMATYGATKAFVLSFSEALWTELRERRAAVRMVCLCPGATRTDFGNAVGSPRGRFENQTQDTPAEVALVGLDALDRNASFSVVGVDNYLTALAPRLLPRAAMTDIAGIVLRPESAPRPSAIAAATRRRAGIAALAVAGLTALGYGIRRASAQLPRG
jgi:short-subunit dehydrogenase